MSIDECYIEFARRLGEEIAFATGQRNDVENDIRKALGRYYQKFC
jgi:hypothetical protein